MSSINLEFNKKILKLLLKNKIYNLVHQVIFIHLFQAVIMMLRLVVQVWKVGIFAILREYLLKNNNQQSNLPQTKKPKDLK